MAKALAEMEDAVYWQGLLAKMDPLAVSGDDGALLVSPDEALEESHRHFSHLMSIYPLGILDIEGTERERRIIDASLEQMDALGTKYWCGYSFSWMACMRARVGQADKALQNLTDYLDCTTRNGFHVNGPQTREELSSYKMRAFTLEGNFAASQAVHEMILQSWGGKIRIFPSVPWNWNDVSFKHLRVEGGFIVDAIMEDGKTIKVNIEATTDQILRLKYPFGKEDYESNIPLERISSGELQCQMKKDQIIRLNIKGK